MVHRCMLPCCVRFFFFKQKTAYEMRISDWSSDVCSSDLKNEAHSVVVRSTVAPRTTEERVAPKLEAIVGREIGNGLGLCFNPEFQIGRASCRERVCQYV